MKPRKSLSQNFLVDDMAARKIVDNLNLTDKDVALEIGAGKGALTRYLLEKANRVIAVEIDRRLCDHLSRKFKGRKNLYIIHGDILKIKPESLFDPSVKGKVVGNLPYKITSPVLEFLINHRDFISLCVLTVQKEVASRICAKPDNRNWSPLSIAVQLYCEVESLFHLKPDSFFPTPKVYSSVVRIAFSSEERVSLPDKKLFFKVIRAAFTQRRKMLTNTLTSSLGLPKRELEHILIDVNIDPKRRPESLSIEEYANLSAALSKVMK